MTGAEAEKRMPEAWGTPSRYPDGPRKKADEHLMILRIENGHLLPDGRSATEFCPMRVRDLGAGFDATLEMEG